MAEMTHSKQRGYLVTLTDTEYDALKVKAMERDALAAECNEHVSERIESKLKESMAAAVKTYDCTNGGAQFCQGCYTMTESTDNQGKPDGYGEWVRREDAAALMQSLEAALRELLSLADITQPYPEHLVSGIVSRARAALDALRATSETKAIRANACIFCGGVGCPRCRLHRKSDARESLCEGCPSIGYPTDETRCTPCPRRTTPYEQPISYTGEEERR